jgi:hypothetical protein
MHLGVNGLADPAYTLSEKLLIPFIGVNQIDPINDAFDYYLLQLQIRFEMAFGRLLNMFCILSGKIEGRMDSVSAILMTCARLHNFILQQERPFGKALVSVKEEMEQLDITP